MSYKIIQCQKNCCLLRCLSYDQNLNVPYVVCKDHIKKAGCFIYDYNRKKVLLVQSRGQLWGAPKGSVENDENPLDCAIREVKEETGLTVSDDNFKDSIIINSKALYYFVEMDSTDIILPQEFHGNDANGIGWVNIDCLGELIQNDVVHINKHCKILIEKVFEVDLPFTSGRSSSVKTCLLHTLAQE